MKEMREEELEAMRVELPLYQIIIIIIIIII